MAFTFLILLTLCKSQFQPTPLNSVSLTTSNTVQNGASIIDLGSNNMNTNNGKWNIEVKDQIGFFLEISLDSTWGFHPSKESVIQFTVYGQNNNPNDGELLIAFSVGENQYVVTRLSIDNGNKNKISPKCGTSMSIGSIKNNVASAESNGDTTRVKKATAGSGGQWKNFETNNNKNGYDNEWPLMFTLTNDPINDNAFVKLENPSWIQSAFSQECKFNAFPTNQGLQIFLSPRDVGESFSFSQFDIDYSYDLTYDPTSAPTFIPTPAPTNDPSPAPTNDPTAAPTGNPTSSPTDNPTRPGTTRSPTNAPTLNPISSPTTSPTNIPITDPTMSPESDPTIYSTLLPTNYPTHNPSDSPLLSPTDSSSSTPTISPVRRPTHSPTSKPTSIPSSSPTSSPSCAPIGRPTHSPSQKPIPRPVDPPTLNIVFTQSPTESVTISDDADDIATTLSQINKPNIVTASYGMTDRDVLIIIIGISLAVCFILCGIFMILFRIKQQRKKNKIPKKISMDWIGGKDNHYKAAMSRSPTDTVSAFPNTSDIAMSPFEDTKHRRQSTFQQTLEDLHNVDNLLMDNVIDDMVMSISTMHSNFSEESHSMEMNFDAENDEIVMGDDETSGEGEEESDDDDALIIGDHETLGGM